MISNGNAVEMREVRKRFGSVVALDGLNLAVPKGTIYGVLGPNGAGKTTALRTLAGLLEPDGGTAEILGRRPGDSAVLGRMGYMPQSPALYEELSVRENVEFFAACYGRGSAALVNAAIELVGLAARSGSPVHTLSGGLKQRASLACAVSHQPEILLLDEPTAGVDPSLRAAFWEHFRKLAGSGTTILISSHVMDEAERCDTLGLILRGRLLAEGPAEAIRKRAGVATLEDAFLKLAGVGDVGA